MRLSLLPQELAVLRLKPSDPVPEWVFGSSYFSVTKTSDELSIFCDSAAIPEIENKIPGWRAIRVAGQLDLDLTGILSALSAPLAAKQIPVFSISTHDTDYMLLRKEHLEDAIDVLQRAGHSMVPFEESMH